MIPCPIGEGCGVLPEANRAVVDAIDYFIVENVRSARRFLGRGGMGRPVEELTFVECNEHTRAEDLRPMLEPLLEGRDAGFISEAGVPGVADPGAEIAALCHRTGIRVVPLVGPSSILLALMASGQNGQSFAFNGYLPVKAPERQRAIRRFERRAHEERQTQIFIEAPYRNRKLFDDLLAVCSAETHLCVACDLAEPDQYVRSQRIAEWKKSGAPLFEKRPAIFILF